MERLPTLRHGVWLHQSDPLPSEAWADLGGKASTLMALAQQGFPVLPGLVLLPSACQRPGTAAASLPDRLDGDLLEELIGALPELLNQAKSLAGKACSADAWRGGRWAVRSSGRAEDGERASYAGQFATQLEVGTADLEAAILAVWRSAFTPALASYRRGRLRGEPGTPEQPFDVPAVLIQPMLAPRFAGVAFSADPVSGRRGVTLVQGVPGVAAALVAGAVEGESWLLDRAGRLLDHRPAPSDGLAPAQPCYSPPPLPGLTEPEVRSIASLARRLGHHFGIPQDLEWALLADGGLWLLQSRPISTLAGLDDPDGRLALWDNSNIVESYGGVTTPLTFSFARKAYSEVYAQFCRFMGVREATIRRNRSVFGSMIGFLEGRIYYNLLNWYRVLALLPGYRLNSRFLEQMLGVKHGLPSAQMDQIRDQQRSEVADGALPLVFDGLRLGRSLLGLVANALSIRRRSRAFRRRLDRVLLPPAPLAALADARPDELVALYRRIEAELLSHWDAPLINDFYAMISYGLLRGLAQRWCPPAQAQALHDWIAGDASVISAEPPRRIRAMAALVADRPKLVEILQRGNPATLRRAVAAFPPLQRELDRYLDDFGDRCLEELKLETLTLREDPLPLLRSIGAMVDRLSSSPSRIGRDSSQAPAASGPAAHSPGGAERGGPDLSGHPLRSLVLRWLRDRTRDLVSNRENLRFERTRVFGLARRILLELGGRLRGLGLLDRAEDVVFLEVDEVLGVVEGNGSTTDLKGLVAVRRAEWQRQRLQAPLPRRLETRGLPALASAAVLSAPAPLSDHPAGGLDSGLGAERLWQGIGCAPGLVRAQVSLVRDPRQWLDSPRQRGRACPILVAGSTDPGWVLLFPHAAGLLVERGSVLSHVAIVARELGLPMVTDLVGIAGSLREGDWVEMDGRSGRVVCRPSGPSAPSP